MSGKKANSFLTHTALYIRFAKSADGKVQSEVLEVANGSDLVLDRDSDGKIVGIEIVGGFA